MDCSEEVQSLSDEASTPIELKKGMSIFLDVSRLSAYALNYVAFIFLIQISWHYYTDPKGGKYSF